jgi:hypothetical protein
MMTTPHRAGIACRPLSADSELEAITVRLLERYYCRIILGVAAADSAVKPGSALLSLSMAALNFNEATLDSDPATLAGACKPEMASEWRYSGTTAHAHCGTRTTILDPARVHRRVTA